MAKILHVTTTPISLLFLNGQVGYMRSLGHEISVATAPGERLTEFGRTEGARIYPVPIVRAISPAEDLRALASLIAVIRETSPDIVHSHTPKGGLLGMLAARVAGIQARIYHMRGLRFVTSTGLRRSVLANAENLSCSLATRVLCVSRSLRESALSEGVGSREKMTVVSAGSGNGVDAAGRFDPERLPDGTRAAIREELGIPPDAFVIGFVGRLVRDKGVVELVEAWGRLRDVVSGHLLLVGDYEEEDPVPADVRQRIRQDPRVHCLGFRSDTERLYSAMDLVVLPSYREGFPNVPLEAASMGLPVVATRIAGCQDAVVNGETGLLIAPRSASELVEAVQAYYTDARLRASHGEAGRRRVRKYFRREVIWEGIAKVYEEELNARRREGPSASEAPRRTGESDAR